jgi:hypothetical protein
MIRLFNTHKKRAAKRRGVMSLPIERVEALSDVAIPVRESSRNRRKEARAVPMAMTTGKMKGIWHKINERRGHPIPPKAANWAIS